MSATFEDKVKKLVDENLSNGHFSTPNWWRKHHPDVAERLLNEFHQFKEVYFRPQGLTMSHYIKIAYCGVSPNVLGVWKKYDDVIEFAKDFDESLLWCRNYRKMFKGQYHRIVDFDTDNLYEVVYCFKHNLRKRPLCPQCGKELSFISYEKGYHHFCSAKCQLDFHNKLKPVGHSNDSKKVIVSKILEIPTDRRNLTNNYIASVYENICEYCTSVHLPDDLPVKQKIDAYVRNLSLDDVICPCCNVALRKFLSQNRGYSKTCCDRLCIAASSNRQEIDRQNILKKNGRTERQCFIYIMKCDIGVKIGISKDPISRCRRLSSVMKHNIVFSAFMNDALSCEQKIHNQLSDKRVKLPYGFDGYTEYFDLRDDEINRIKEYICEQILN